MPDYKSMYLLLFDKVAETIDQLRSDNFTPTTRVAINTLVTALQQCEEVYVESSKPIDDCPEEDITPLKTAPLPPIRIISNK